MNPDFSQVGIDNPAAPNQRFPPYYAEVRPFFIENSSYFPDAHQPLLHRQHREAAVWRTAHRQAGRWAMGVLGVDDRSPGELVPAGRSQCQHPRRVLCSAAQPGYRKAFRRRTDLHRPRIRRLLQSRRRNRLPRAHGQGLDGDRAGRDLADTEPEQLHPGRAGMRETTTSLQRPGLVPASQLLRSALGLVGSAITTPRRVL